MTIAVFAPAASAQHLVCADLRQLLHPAHRGVST